MSQWHQKPEFRPILLALRIDRPKALLVALSFATVMLGCRGSWNQSSTLRSEPSFDRLIELESGSNSDQGMSSAESTRFSDRDSVHPEVAQRRPGGRTAASRHLNIQEQSAAPVGQNADETEVKKPITGTPIARRKISDVERDDSLEESDEHTQLLQQTQTAVKNRYRTESLSNQESPPPSQMVDAEDQPSQATQRKTHASFARDEPHATPTESSPVVAIRMNDRPNNLPHESGTASVQEEPFVVAASHQKNGSDNSPTVQPAVHNRYQPDTSRVPEASRTPEGKEDSPTTSLKVQNSDDSISELQWQEHLELAMKQLPDGVSATDASSTTTNEQRRQAVIKRLLALALGDREKMTSSVEGLPPHEQEYLKYQLNAILDAIDLSGNPVSSRRWSLVMLNQRKAHEQLATLSNLEVSSLAFCTSVESFGVSERFPKYQFTPDQEVLLYCEVDNFVSERSKDGKGFETQLQGSYEIVDSGGKRVADQSLPMDTHICRNLRRDYFIAYRVYMPQNISPGSYSLRLTIEDIKGRKFGQSEVAFQIQ